MNSTSQHSIPTDETLSHFPPALLPVSAPDDQTQIQYTFVTDISHKLRTPLTNIKLYLALLEKSTPDDHARYIETIKREADRLQNITEDMLMLSQFDMGKIEPVFERVNLERLLHNVVTARRQLAISRGVRLGCGSINNEFLAKLATLQSDKLLLKEIFRQLLTNAIVYTGEGGTVTVEVTVEVAPRCDNEQRWCAVSIRDTGAGIEPSETKRIFERSYRGRSSFEMGIAGTGLGLTICQQAAQHLGGSIVVESTPDVGSTFTLLLPI